MIECQLDTYPVVYLTAIRIAAAITLPVNIFGLYCVYAKTPKHMTDARLILFTYQIFNTLSDFLFSVLMEPVMTYPLPFGNFFGLMKLVDFDLNKYERPTSVQIGIVLCLSAVATTYSSFLQTIHFRLNFVLPEKSIFKFRGRWKFIATRTCYYLVMDGAFLAAYFIFQGDLTSQARSLLKTYSCAANLMASTEIKMLDWYKMKSIFYVFLAEMSFVIVVSIFIMITSYYYINRLPVVSEKTRRLQKEFQLSLCLQAFIPMVVLLIPGTLFTSFILIGYMGVQTFSNITVFLTSTLGFLGTVIMLCFNGHYRRYVIHLFTLRKYPVHSET